MPQKHLPQTIRSSSVSTPNSNDGSGSTDEPHGEDLNSNIRCAQLPTGTIITANGPTPPNEDYSPVSRGATVSNGDSRFSGSLVGGTTSNMASAVQGRRRGILNPAAPNWTIPSVSRPTCNTHGGIPDTIAPLDPRVSTTGYNDNNDKISTAYPGISSRTADYQNIQPRRGSMELLRVDSATAERLSHASKIVSEASAMALHMPTESVIELLRARSGPRLNMNSDAASSA